MNPAFIDHDGGHPDALEKGGATTPAATTADQEILEFFTNRKGGSNGIILEGDAFDLIEKLPPESVDLVLTSPPYWGLRDYGMEHNWEIDKEWKTLGNRVEQPPPYDWYRSHGGILGLEPLPEWYVSNVSTVINKFAGVLKQSGSMWLNIGDTYFARWASIRPDGRQGLGGKERHRRKTPMGGFRQEKNLLLIPSRVAIALQDARWILRNDLIWFKPNVPPRPDKDRLRLAHEHFFHFVKRPKEGRAKYYYEKDHAEPGDADVVTCTAKSGESGHSATFPSDIIRPRILTSSPPGGVVLDPFCGTARTLVETMKTGRRALGFEITGQFAAAGRRAIANIQVEF